jgi:hypothetical protein
MFLCTFDTAGIQRYVFASNALRDVVGGSLLVAKGLDELLREAGRPLGEGWWETSPDPWPESGLPAVRITSAGGNAQVAVREEEAAWRLARDLLRLAGERAPGLRIVAAVTPWGAEEAYAEADDRAREALARNKAASSADVPDLPAPIERCGFTREPAVGRDRLGQGDVSRPISASVRARREEVLEHLDDAVHPGLEEVSARCRAESFALTSEIEKMRGRKGEQSFIAVVHLDANGMGTAFRSLRGGQLSALRSASEGVDAAAARSVARVIDRMRSALSTPDEDGRAHSDQLPKVGERPVLPIRPILVGGDDVTLLVEGSWGLDVAVLALTELVGGLGELGFRGGACAGVSFGRAHAPFAQLAKAAYEVTQRAKKASRAAGGSFIDWSFLGERDEGCRPYPLEPTPKHPVSANLFLEEVLSPVQQSSEKIRGQLERLALALRSGPEATLRQRQLWRDRGIDEDGALSWGDQHLNGLHLASGGSPWLEAIALHDFVLVPALRKAFWGTS